MNVAQHIDRAARFFPTGAAIVSDSQVTTYSQLRARIHHVAAGLVAAGVKPGDRVALLLPNIPAFVVAYQACQWVGAVTVSLNVMLTTEELRYVLADSGAGMIFTTETLWPMLAPLADARTVVVCEGTID